MPRYTLKSGSAYVSGLSRNPKHGLTISHDEPSFRRIYQTHNEAQLVADDIMARFAMRQLTLRGTNKLFHAHVRVVTI